MREMSDEAFPQGEELHRPHEERDEERNDWCEERPSREVNVQLEVRYALNKIAKKIQDGKVLEWDQVRLRSYNGKLVGPIIEVRPGDTLNVFLDNQLPKDRRLLRLRRRATPTTLHTASTSPTSTSTGSTSHPPETRTT